MKNKLYLFVALLAVIFAALAGNASASFIYSKVSTETGTLCGSSCTYVLHDNTSGSTITTQGVTLNYTAANTFAYWYSLGGLGDYGSFPFNAVISAQTAGHNYVVYAKKLCPNGISWKYTETKGFHLANTTDPWNMGNLTLQASGCQTVAPPQ